MPQWNITNWGGTDPWVYLNSAPNYYVFTANQYFNTAGWADGDIQQDADGNIYYTGGQRAYDGNSTNTVFKYSPATETWSNQTFLSVNRRSHGGGLVGDYLYIIGGIDESGTRVNTCLRQNYKTNSTWATRTAMSTVLAQQISCVYNGKIYQFGGYNGTSWTNTLRIYDPEADSWDYTKGNMPGSAGIGCAVLKDGYIYIIPVWNGTTYENRFWKYDPVNDTWDTSSLAKMPLSIGTFGYTLRGDDLYIITGAAVTTGSYFAQQLRNNIFKYNFPNNEWTELKPFVEPKYYASAFTYNGTIYLFGGVTPTANHYGTYTKTPSLFQWTG